MMTDIESLVQHPQNPRKGSIASIERSIRRNGFFGAVVAQTSTRRILVGNHRVQAAKNVGITEVPVVWVDCDDDRALAILLADNRTSDHAIYDEEDLARLLGTLDAELVIDAGWSSYDLARLVEVSTPDLPPPAMAEPSASASVPESRISPSKPPSKPSPSKPSPSKPSHPDGTEWIVTIRVGEGEGEVSSEYADLLLRAVKDWGLVAVRQ